MCIRSEAREGAKEQRIKEAKGIVKNAQGGPPPPWGWHDLVGFTRIFLSWAVGG